MNRTIHNRSGNSVITALCSIIFLSFSFVWLYKGEGEALRCLHYTLSGGMTTYSPLCGALIITALLWLLQWGLNMLMRFARSLSALAFFPAYLILTLLSCINPDTSGADTSHFAVSIDKVYLWGGGLFFIFYLIAGFFNRKLQNRANREKKQNVIIPNVLILIVFTYITGFVGNTNEVFHNELAVAQAIREGDFDKALQKGIKSPHHSRTLTALRALALSHTHTLGEKLFAYPQTEGAEGLFLDEADGAISMVTNDDICNHLGAHPKMAGETVMTYLDRMCRADSASHEAREYYLCALLLEKELDIFQQALPLHYRETDKSLPRHYQEALLLKDSAGEMLVTDSTVRSRFGEFMALRDQYPDPVVQNNHIRRQFGDTYWWYYYYGGKEVTGL